MMEPTVNDAVVQIELHQAKEIVVLLKNIELSAKRIHELLDNAKLKEDQNVKRL